MAAAMGEMLGRGVSFLIADFSGRSLNRLGHIEANGEPGSRIEETAERVRLDGSACGDALADRRSVVLREVMHSRDRAGDEPRRGVGVPELVLPFEPAAAR